MQYGAVFPTSEIGSDPIAIRDWAQTAEALGYARVVAYDHVLGAVHADREPRLTGPYDESNPFHEPFVLFGYLAGLTSTIELATGVLVGPQRQTALVAKQAAELAVLSSGRLVLGLGTGWNHVEYEALGMPYDDRGARLTAQAVVIRRLLDEPVIDHSDDYHRIDRAGILPLPANPIPIWFGGASEPALRRAAHLGDGFLFGAAGRTVRSQLERLRELLDEHGRDRAEFKVEAQIDFARGEAAWVGERDKWAEVGGDYLSVQTMDVVARWAGREELNGFTSAAQHIGALETFMRVVNEG
jgi:probable F420-dependent oxidoreductase